MTGPGVRRISMYMGARKKLEMFAVGDYYEICSDGSGNEAI